MEHAYWILNPWAQWQALEPLLGHIYALLCFLLSIPSYSLNHSELPAHNRKPQKRNRRHKYNTKTPTLYNKRLSAESSSAHSEPKHECKNKDLPIKANPLHLTQPFCSHGTVTRHLQKQTTNINLPLCFAQHTPIPQATYHNSPTNA